MNLQSLREQLSIISEESPNIGIVINIIKKEDYSIFNANI